MVLATVLRKDHFLIKLEGLATVLALRVVNVVVPVVVHQAQPLQKWVESEMKSVCTSAKVLALVKFHVGVKLLAHSGLFTLTPLAIFGV